MALALNQFLHRSPAYNNECMRLRLFRPERKQTKTVTDSNQHLGAKQGRQMGKKHGSTAKRLPAVGAQPGGDGPRLSLQPYATRKTQHRGNPGDVTSSCTTPDSVVASPTAAIARDPLCTCHSLGPAHAGTCSSDATLSCASTVNSGLVSSRDDVPLLLVVPSSYMVQHCSFLLSVQLEALKLCSTNRTNRYMKKKGASSVTAHRSQVITTSRRAP